MGIKEPPLPSVRLPPPSAHVPTLGSTSAALTQQTAQNKAKKAEGLGSDDTIKTSPQGLAAPTTAKTTLLGG